ncbi:hypothetical protein SEA_HIBISCUS_27 [Gordonia phage Hibiscus]|uniref:Uncharacterized protein n=1 Tax=Gordonia phage Santhid TaxID=2927281 RepID=A0AAE9GKD0_9CAUD|nr:hypothetical protein QLQ75_gp27 [Gordonia phage Santhid]UOK18022.1 hypothetical protein SEA_SANTHID_27 [Gordonia phage Santhid]
MREWFDDNGSRHWIDENGREHVDIEATQEFSIDVQLIPTQPEE